LRYPAKVGFHKEKVWFYWPLQSKLVGTALNENWSYELGRKMMPVLAVIVTPKTVSVTGDGFEYDITDGPKYRGDAWEALTPLVICVGLALSGVFRSLYPGQSTMKK
jgi:hypothetical protein